MNEISDDCWGTSDAVILGKNNRMVVADLKSGNFPVDVNFNEQLMTYSLGALARWGDENTVVEITIIQPSKKSFDKAGPISTWDIQAVDLVDWGFNILKPACEEALGESPTYNAGDWCRFCAYKPDCATFQNNLEVKQ